MRLLLKRDSKYHRIFKITVRGNKAGNQQLVGHITLFDWIKDFLPNAKDVDIHFSYFSDGNYHFTYRYFDTVEQLFVDRKVYHNSVAFKKGVTFKPEDMQKVGSPRARSDNDPLDGFMMNEKLSSWNTNPLGHTFTTMGTTLTKENLEKLEWHDEKKVKDDEDLIIDTSKYQDEQVSFGCSFYSEGNPTHDFTVTPIDRECISRYYKFGGLVLHMYMVLVNKPVSKLDASE